MIVSMLCGKTDAGKPHIWPGEGQAVLAERFRIYGASVLRSSCLFPILVFATAPLLAEGAVFGKAARLEGNVNRACCLEREGNHLYVAGRGALAVYDIAKEPSRPKLLGELRDIGSARQLAVQNGIAYFTARANGLWIIDCRTPTKPAVLGHYPSTSNCTGIDVAGAVCFIGGSRRGIEFVDVSDPRRPRFIRCERVPPVESQSVAYRDGILYSGEWSEQCVTIWDVRDMKAPKRLVASPLLSNGDGVWPDGRWLYASTGFNSRDKQPSPQSHLKQMGLEIHDVAAPTHPKRVGRVDFDYCRPGGYDMWIVRASGDRAYCAQTYGGLYAVDVSDKTAPKVLDRWLPERRVSVSSLAVGDGVVYVAGFGLGAWVIEAKGAVPVTCEKGRPPVNADLRTPRPAPPEGFYRWLPEDPALDINVTGLAVRGDVCYAAAGTAGLYVLELSTQGIRELKRVPLAECMDVAIAGNRLFAAAGYEGWIVYEINAPDALREMARIPDAAARDVYAYGDGTRWAAFNTTVHDITNLSNPRPLVNLVHQARYNKFLSPDLIGGKWAAGNTALKHFGWADLSASSVKGIPVTGYKSHMGGICAFGDQAFLADKGMWTILAPGKSEMEALKKFPGKKGTLGLPRWNGGAWVSLSGVDRTAAIWDFSDRANPRLIKFFKLPCNTDPASFWRETLVFPARRQGVLLPHPAS